MFKIFLFFLIVMVILVIFAVVFSIVGIKSINKYAWRIADIAWFGASVSYIFMVFSLFIQTISFTINLLFTLLNQGFQLMTLDLLASSYLALTVTLIVIAYVPEWYGYPLFKLIGKVIKPNPNVNLSKLYRIFFRWIKPRLLMYITSFLLVVVSSVEMFTGTSLINNKTWLQFKPVVLQSVVTFIAFDRAYNLLITEWKGMASSFKELHSEVRSISTVFNSKKLPGK